MSFAKNLLGFEITSLRYTRRGPQDRRAALFSVLVGFLNSVQHFPDCQPGFAFASMPWQAPGLLQCSTGLQRNRNTLPFPYLLFGTPIGYLE